MPSWACLQGRGWTQIRPPALKFYLNGNSNVSQMISDGDTQHPPPRCLHVQGRLQSEGALRGWRGVCALIHAMWVLKRRWEDF